MMRDVREQAKAAKRAWQDAVLTDENRRAVLLRTADRIHVQREAILQANAKDLERAAERGLSAAMQDRLRLSDQRLDSMIDGLLDVAELQDPLHKVLDERVLENGLKIRKETVPLGLIGIIYEARPNVTIEAASLIFRAGNAVILRGGSAAEQSNAMLTACYHYALEAEGLNRDLIQHVEDTSRESSLVLMQCHEYVDVLVPRGGRSLIDQVIRGATVPVIRTGDGNDHIYVARSADPDSAVKIIANAKLQRPSVCNAVETLLVDAGIADNLLPRLAEVLGDDCELRPDEQAAAILGGDRKIASEEDWATEYNDRILAIRVVPDMDKAMAHIREYGTMHSEAILTEDMPEAERFLNQVDAAVVYLNASTRFTDGAVFGFGGELGISTQKLHARGPMGLEALVSYKYKVYGNGQVR